jgi:hypothetical protein
MDAGASSTLLLLALGTRPRLSISYHGASLARSLDPCVLIAPHYVQPRRAMPIALCSELDSVASTNGILRIRCLSMGYRLSITLQPSAHATQSHAILDPPPPISDSAGRCAPRASVAHPCSLLPIRHTHTHTHAHARNRTRTHAFTRFRHSERAELSVTQCGLGCTMMLSMLHMHLHGTPPPPRHFFSLHLPVSPSRCGRTEFETSGVSTVVGAPLLPSQALPLRSRSNLTSAQ